MATIAKLTTQDGPAAAGPATDGAGGDAGAEFTALLTEATGAPLAAPAEPLPLPAAPPSADAAAQPAEPDGAAPAGVLVLAVPADLLRAPARDAKAPDPPTGRANPRAQLRLELPPLLPGPVVSPDTGSAAVAQAVPGGSPMAMPAVAAPVAAAVLQALQPGPRPVTTVATAAPGAPADATPAPIATAVARLIEAVEDVAATGTDADAHVGPEGDGALAGTTGQPGSGGLALRDAVAQPAHPRALAGSVGTPPWREALGTELRLMIERGVGAATLRLSPEHLGPLEVRISFTDDNASVWFTAAHADTRAALADALPRLRDMLASVGVNLAEAGVQRDLSGEPGEAGRRAAAWRGAGAEGAEAGADVRVVVARLDPGRGMVDEYA